MIVFFSFFFCKIYKTECEKEDQSCKSWWECKQKPDCHCKHCFLKFEKSDKIAACQNINTKYKCAQTNVFKKQKMPFALCIGNDLICI